MFLICSYCPMKRLTHEMLALHLETALATAPADALARLHAIDRSSKRAAALALAEYLADRLACFEFRERDAIEGAAQEHLFANDLGPIK